MFVGIDVGTSSVKAVMVGADQKIVAQSSESLAVAHPAPLWSEQDPKDWWLACDRAMAGLRARAGRHWSDVVGMGLSGQMHGAVLLGDDDRPLRPAILWNDGRAAAACLELERRVSCIIGIGLVALAGLVDTPWDMHLAEARNRLHFAD